nr:TPA_asm: P6 [Pogostemom alphacytorhabdovirus 3_Lag]
MIVDTDEYMDNLKEHINKIHNEYGRSLTVIALNCIASVYIIFKFTSKIMRPVLRAMGNFKGAKGRVVHHIL